MKFRTVNELQTIGLNDMKIERVRHTEQDLILTLSGGIIKAENKNNTRYQDVYCMQMILELQDITFQSFCLQGFQYFNADGKLLKKIPDQPLEQEEIREALSKAEGARVYEFEPAGDSFLLTYDVLDEDGDIEATYQAEFTVGKSIASWDRFSGPVE